MNRTSLLYVFFFIGVCGFSQHYTFSGTVLDEQDNTPLIGVNVINLSDSTVLTTNQSGVFKLQTTTTHLILQLSYLGYEAVVDSINLRNVKHKDYSLKMSAFQTDMVVIEAEQNIINQTQPGLVELSAKDIDLLPAFMGEPDVIGAIKLQPGVQAAGDGNSGYHVRGGEADQNLILLDNGVVYNPSHVLGFFSVFNSKAIDHAKLIKSGMPASYGGRLSSVLAIQTKTPDMYVHRGDVNVGLISSNVYMSVPIIKSKVSASVAFRRTYLDEVVKPVVNLFIDGGASFYSQSSYFFNDVNVKLALQPNNKNLVSLSYYTGTDKYTLNESNYNYNNQLAWGNNLFTANWRHRFGKQLLYNLHGSHSNYNFMFTADHKGVVVDLESTVSNLRLNQNFYYFVSERMSVSAGNELMVYAFNPNTVDATLNDVDLQLGVNTTYRAMSHSAFIQTDVRWSNFSISAGVRIPSYYQLGPYTRKSDSVYFKYNEQVLQLNYIEPRFAFKYQLGNYTAFKTSVTKNVQFVHLAPTSAVTLPTDIWVHSSEQNPPQEAWQFSQGYFYQNNQRKLQFYTDVFYKQMKNMVVLTSGIIDSYVNRDIEQNLVNGDGTAYGIEFFVKQAIHSFDYSLSYTISKNWRKFDSINYGQIFPAKFDRLHNVSFNANYQLSERWAVSSSFIYATGNALTLPASWALINGNLIAIPGAYHGFRMPAYHRLDMAFTYHFNPSHLKESVLNFSIFNLYNRANPFYIYFEFDGNLDEHLSIKPRQISLFPIVPSITWKIKW